MDEFHINFNILGNMVISTLVKRLSCQHQSRKEKERKAAKREKRNGVGLANHISPLKNTMNSNKYTVKRYTVSSFFFVLANNRVISWIMYRMAVIIGKISRGGA